MRELTPSQKGAAAEAAFAAAAIRLAIPVLCPWGEGGRYDLVFDLEPRLLRVQCKWAPMHDGVIAANVTTSRHTPNGYVRTRYTPAEVDAIGAFNPDTNTCYLVPMDVVADRSMLYLRIAPTRNNQARGIQWARDFEFATALEHHWRWTSGRPPSANGRAPHR